jgi:hypothetical protein
MDRTSSAKPTLSEVLNVSETKIADRIEKIWKGAKNFEDSVATGGILFSILARLRVEVSSLNFPNSRRERPSSLDKIHARSGAFEALLGNT